MKKLIDKIKNLSLALGAGMLFAIKPAGKHRVWHGNLKKYDYAHRGLHNSKLGILENTIPAFDQAVKHGYGIELDVHLTRDDKLVVFHDNTLERACKTKRKVKDLSLEELQSYGLFGTEETMPEFSQVLKNVQGRVPLVIELKTVESPRDNTYKRLCSRVLEELECYRGEYCLESFDPRVLMWLRKNKPEIVRGQLMEHFRRHGSKVNKVYNFLARNLFFNFLTKPDFIAYQYLDRDCLAMYLAKKLYGIQEVSWTVRDADTARFLKGEGALVILEGYHNEA